MAVSPNHPPTLRPAYRVRDVVARYRVTDGKVLGWIKSGKLRAIDVSSGDGQKARWRILPEDLEAFELSLTVNVTPRAKRRAASGWTYQYF